MAYVKFWENKTLAKISEFTVLSYGHPALSHRAAQTNLYLWVIVAHSCRELPYNAQNLSPIYSKGDGGPLGRGLKLQETTPLTEYP